MVKVGKQDIRYAMTSIIDREMKKQQKAELEEMMEKLYNGSYADNCPYCKRIVVVNGKDENTRINEVNGKKYLIGACQFCKKEIYVRIVMQPPKSMLDSPSARGYFFSREDANGSDDNAAEPVKSAPVHKFTVRTWKNSDH